MPSHHGKQTGKRRQSPSSAGVKNDQDDNDDNIIDNGDENKEQKTKATIVRRSLRPRRSAYKSMKEPSDDEGFLESVTSDEDDVDEAEEKDDTKVTRDDNEAPDDSSHEEDDESRPSQRRRPAKRRRIDLKANKGSSSTGKKKQGGTHADAPASSSEDSDHQDNTKEEDEGEEEEEESSDYDGDYEDDKHTRRGPDAMRRRNASRKVSAAKKKMYRGPEADRTCPHCGKICSSKEGLKYHLTKMVCRKPKTRPSKPSNDPAATTDRVNSGTGSITKAKKAYPKIRGAKDGRTCPHCKRVFTSLLGRNYHVQHKVCTKEISRGSSRQPKTLMHTLEAGERFVTKFGVVEVVRDDQAIPTAVTDNTYKDTVRKYLRKVDRKESSNAKINAARTVYSCVKRHLMNKAHSTGGLFPSRLFRNSMDLPQASNLPLPPTDQEDPSAPRASFPDRIVVCKMVADDRERRTFIDDEEDGEGSEKARDEIHPIGLNHTLFLQRRLLTTPYEEDETLYVCRRCGRIFESIVGFKYHAKGDVTKCETKHKKHLDQAKAARERLADRVRRGILRMETVSGQRVPASPGETKKRPPSSATFSTKNKRRRFKLSGGHSVYPSIWLGLGFIMPPKIKKSFYKEEDESSEEEVELEVVDPNEKLKELRAELTEQEGKRERDLYIAAEHKKGAMYPGVYHSLGFSIPFRQRKRELRRAALAAAAAVERAAEIEESGESSSEDEGSSASEEENEEDKETASEAPTLPSPQHPTTQDAEEGKAEEQKRPTKRRRKRRKKETQPAPPPPVINSQVLVSEIDKGRYPSRKRYHGNHKDYCQACKERDGDLTACGFCHNAVHMQCMMERLPIQNPESNPDFICYVCIRYILAMRRRAERRRIRKLVGKQEGGHGGSKTVDKAAMDEVGKIEQIDSTARKEPTYESEFHKLTAVGHELHELLQLLGDARQGLTILTEASRLNGIRRLMMADEDESVS